MSSFTINQIFLTFFLLFLTYITSAFEENDDQLGRFQYHQQGLDGAHHVSYRFGFVSDDVENPLSRHEVSLGPGHVTGAYSFVDANNKWQIVQYESHPEHGFRIVKQWSQDRENSQRRRRREVVDGRAISPSLRFYQVTFT